MSPEAESFIKNARIAKVIPGAEINHWLAQGRVELLYEIAQELLRSPHSRAGDTRTGKWIVETILRGLCLTAGAAATGAILRLFPLLQDSIAARRLPADRHLRANDIAQMLAATQPTGLLREIVAAYASDLAYTELIACLVQETVLRRKAEDSTLWRAAIKGTPVAAHPLSWLPLTLSEIEAGLPMYLPRYGPQSVSVGMASNAAQDQTVAAAAGRPGTQEKIEALTASWCAELHPIHDVTTPDRAEQILTAVLPWKGESNGRLEARLFTIDQPISAGMVDTCLLAACGLDSAPAATPDNVNLVPASPAEVLSSLFSASSGGGAYGGDRCGAFGRYDAWRSIAALAGAPTGSTFHEAEAAVYACRGWWTFYSTSSWFFDVAWDIGLICLRADGRSLAVLAATDTD